MFDFKTVSLSELRGYAAHPSYRRFYVWIAEARYMKVPKASLVEMLGSSVAGEYTYEYISHHEKGVGFSLTVRCTRSK